MNIVKLSGYFSRIHEAESIEHINAIGTWAKEHNGEWCQDPESYRWNISFQNTEDAVAFKLTFGI